MHNIWSRLGYSYLDLKLTFRGKNNNGIPLSYNVVHNEYVVDAYVPISDVVKAISAVTKNFSYIHGYPSAIYSFCKYLKENNVDASYLFKGKLKGVFLGSEYPAPHYRELIEDVLNVSTLSWYGHSEMAVLAYEKSEHFKYSPLQTYGFVESFPTDEKANRRLLGTSYYNTNSPFIRYDTGDLVNNETFENDILTSFEISSGRVGDFILDAVGTSISLTSIIFGRHHEAFNMIDFVQVEQLVKGKAILHVVSKNDVDLSYFDLKNVDIEFQLKITPTPFLTPSGKVPLLINKPEEKNETNTPKHS
jgi:phenylacetate-CoA ligase